MSPPDSTPPVNIVRRKTLLYSIHPDHILVIFDTFGQKNLECGQCLGENHDWMLMFLGTLPKLVDTHDKRDAFELLFGQELTL